MLPGPTVEILKDRAAMLKEARGFFDKRGVLEVDCCALSPYASIDSHIDVIEAPISENTVGYFHTSPEYAMKRLLSAGIGDVFFLGHVFRRGDIGHFHNPEFAMAEWYRIGMPFAEIIRETCEFLSLFLGSLPMSIVSYRNVFLRYTGIDLSHASLDLLKNAAKRFACQDFEGWDRDAYVHFLLAYAVEPNLGQGELTIVTDYPPDEAALACVVEKNGDRVAERFEIYYEGVELANGYHELSDAVELRRRFEQANAIRKAEEKQTYLLDESFLSAMQRDFPECCGVSVGFDRALMLRHKVKTIGEVLAFGWRSVS